MLIDDDILKDNDSFRRAYGLEDSVTLPPDFLSGAVQILKKHGLDINATQYTASVSIDGVNYDLGVLPSLSACVLNWCSPASAFYEKVHKEISQLLKRR